MAFDISTGRTTRGVGSNTAGMSWFLGVFRALEFGPDDVVVLTPGLSSAGWSSWLWAVAASNRILSASFPLATTVRIMELASVEFDRCRSFWYTRGDSSTWELSSARLDLCLGTDQSGWTEPGLGPGKPLLELSRGGIAR